LPEAAVTVIGQRDVEPTDQMPLTYRERSLAVPIGTDEAIAEQVARVELRHICLRLRQDTRGCFVNIAVFDEFFTGRPTVEPLCVLQWKDWRGEPVVSFPRRGEDLQAPVAREPLAEPRAPSASDGDLFLGPARRPSQVPPAHYEASILAKDIAKEAFLGGDPFAVPRAPKAARPRLTGDELIAEWFERIAPMHAMRTVRDAGYFCLDLALTELPLRGAILHLYNASINTFLVACARGQQIESLVGTTLTATDSCLSQVMRAKHAAVIARVRTVPERYTQLGGLESVILAPLLPSSRFSGVLEFVNPEDEIPFSVDDANAFGYLAEQFSEVLEKLPLDLRPEAWREPPPRSMIT
jgi:hypothetical protein